MDIINRPRPQPQQPAQPPQPPANQSVQQPAPPQEMPAYQNTPIPSTPPKRTNGFAQKLKSISGTILLIITAPLLAIFITSHVFHSYEVDGASMETTLQNGDRLIVYKLPKTFANISGGAYIPDRYDVVIFDRPEKIAAPNSVKHLIKRVIGLPGERVTVKEGVITVYNKEHPDGYDPDKDHDYASGFEQTSGNVDVTVGNREIFVVGDNRGNSTDSRVFGPISVDLLVGDAVARFVPVDKIQKL